MAIRPEAREVVIGSLEDLEGHRVTLDEVNWLAPPLEPGDTCRVQLRYRAPAVPATVVSADDGTVGLALEAAVRAITPGQSGVLYEPPSRVLGGGVIS